MTRPRRIAFLLALLALPALVVLRVARPADATPQAPRVPVLVELFTSEGCSSCPSADLALARLARSQPAAGAQVIPIAWHVDYWDYIGWSDPFASPAFTERQRGYASQLGRGSLYTPQAVVDGRAEMVGSDEAALTRAIEAAARAPKATVSVSMRADGDARIVDVAVGALPAGAEPSELFLVVVETQARSAVKRGENAGRTLDHTAVARRLHRVGPVAQSGEARMSYRINTAKQPCSVVAIVAEQAKRKVWGVTVVPLA